MSAANNPEARLEHGDPAVEVAGLEQVATLKRFFGFLFWEAFRYGYHWIPKFRHWVFFLPKATRPGQLDDGISRLAG